MHFLEYFEISLLQNNSNFLNDGQNFASLEMQSEENNETMEYTLRQFIPTESKNITNLELSWKWPESKDK
jgi:hypothetical protein